MELKGYFFGHPLQKNHYLKFWFSGRKIFGLDNTDSLCT